MTGPPRRELLGAVFLLSWLSAAVFVNPTGDIMSDASLATAVGVVDRHSLELSPDVAISLSMAGGKYYSGVGPGAWLLAAPVYAALRPLISRWPARWTPDCATPYAAKPPHALPKEVYVLQILMVWLLVAPLAAWLAVEVARFALGLGAAPASAAFAALALSLGSLFLPYSCVYSRQCLAYALAGSVVLRQANGRGRPLPPPAAGALLGLSVSIDYAAMFFVAAGLALLWRGCGRRERASMLAGLGLAGLALSCYHTALFGRPWATPYSFRSWTKDVIVARYHGEAVRSDQFQTGPLLGLSHPTWASLIGLTVSPYKGLLLFCPAVACGLAGHRAGWRRPGAAGPAALALGLTIFYVLFIASLKGEAYWSGLPFFFGPRYLLGAIPLAVLGLSHFDLRTWAGKAAAGVVAVSAGLNLLGAMRHDLMIRSDLNSPLLLSPLPRLLAAVIREGPRIPLLDAYGAPRSWQAAAFAAYALAAAGLLARARSLALLSESGV